MKMQPFIGLLLLSSSFTIFVSAFIVPQEIPSLLSLVYSNIPPIRKGTDSRIGFGYRLGDHADFQVQFEIGPQKDTKAIGTSSSSKREVQTGSEFPAKRIKSEEKTLEATKSGTWLQNWFRELRKNDELSKTTESPTSPMISKEAFSQLQKLYQNSDEDEIEETKNKEENDINLTKTDAN